MAALVVGQVNPFLLSVRDRRSAQPFCQAAPTSAMRRENDVYKNPRQTACVPFRGLG